MNYVEFKQAIIAASQDPDGILTIEAGLDNTENKWTRKYELNVNEEYGMDSLCGLAITWKAIETLVDLGCWENYQENDATVMNVDGKCYRIKYQKLTSLETLL